MEISKKFSLLGMSALMVLGVGVGITYGVSNSNVVETKADSAPSADTLFEKVTVAPEDWSGNYLVVYEDPDDSTKGYSFNGLDAANDYVSVTIASNKISYGTNIGVYVTVAAMTNGYSIQVIGSDNNGKYISGTSGSNKLNFGASESLNTLALDASGVRPTSNTSVLTFNSDSNQMRFRYYPKFDTCEWRKNEISKTTSKKFGVFFSPLDVVISIF